MAATRDRRDLVTTREITRSPRPEIAHRSAVVVGIGNYPRKPLENARCDAEAVAEVVERDYGFQVERLLDGQATLAAIERVVADHLGRADASTQWLFYFAGHGWRRDGKGFLAPARVQEGDTATYVSLPALVKRCLASRCGEILIVLDSCHAGQALVRSEDLDDRSSPNLEERRRVRQILCSANSEACARDDGGEPGHSVFTQALLDALDGRAGVHDENGWISLGALQDYVVAEVGRRLLASRQPEPLQQKPIGGHFAGNEEQRDFVFRAVVPRVPPKTVQALRSDETARCLEGLARLEGNCRAQPIILPTAVMLAVEHARPGQGREKAERVQAAKILYRLAGSWDRDEEDWPPSRKAIDAHLGETLSALALEDPLPAVRDWARRGLRWTSRATRARMARELAERRRAAVSHQLRRRAWDALVQLPRPWKTLPWTVWWRVPLSWGRLWSASFGRALVETKGRRRALIWPSTALVLLYLGLASTYYFSTWNESLIVVRAGHPGFKILPGVGQTVVITNHSAQQMKDPSLAREERLAGSWLALRDGAFPWARQLFERLEPAAGGLGEWRMGSERRAFTRFREGIEAEDAEVVPLLGYVALHSDSAARSAVDLLVQALQGDEKLHEPALAALALVRDGRPAAAEAALAALARELPGAPPAGVVARIEATEVLGDLERPQGVPIPKALVQLMVTHRGSSALRLRIARALKSLVEKDSTRLASVLPEVRNAILRGPVGERGAWLSVLQNPAPMPPELERPILATLAVLLAGESDPARQMELISILGARLARSPGTAHPFVPVLARRLGDGKPQVRLAAARALASLPDDIAPQNAAVETLAAVAGSHETSELRTEAVELLGAFRHQRFREPVISALIAASAAGNGLIRNAAVKGLVDQGLDSPANVPRILPVLRSLLADPNPWVRWDAVQGVLLLEGEREEDSPAAFDEVVRTLGADFNSIESRVLMGSLKERLPRTSLAARRRIIRILAAQARDLESFAASEVVDLLRDLEKGQPDLLPAVAVAMAQLLGASDAAGDVRGRAQTQLWELRTAPSAGVVRALTEIFELLRRPGTLDRRAVAEGIGYLAAGHEEVAVWAARRLGSLHADPDSELRAGVAAGLGVLGAQQPRSLPELLPVLLQGLSSEAVVVRAASVRALAEVQLVREVAPWVMARLLVALRDRDPAVRRGAASALAHWGRRLSMHMQAAIDPLRDRLVKERNLEARVEALSALAVIGGDDPTVVARVIELTQSLLTESNRESRVKGALLMRDLGESHPRSASQAITILGSLLRDSDDWVRREALICLFQIGAVNAENAAQAVDTVGPLLLDPEWPSRWDAIANNLGPLVREQPSMAPRAVRLLRALLSSDSLDADSRPLGSTATEALIEALHALSRFRPDSPWPLLLSPNGLERQVGSEVLARIAAEHPEKIPAMLGRLSRYRRSLYPHVRFSAAETAEMLSILDRTAKVVGKPSAQRWKKVLENLSTTVNVGGAVRLALDKLEPRVKHG